MTTIKSILPQLVLLGALIGLPAAFAGEKTKTDPYTQAVTVYVESASQQLRSIRGEVDAVTKNSTDIVKQRYVEVYHELDRCDKLIARMKNAEQVDFDRTKAKFEHARAEMIEVLQTVRRGN